MIAEMRVSAETRLSHRSEVTSADPYGSLLELLMELGEKCCAAERR